MCNRIPALEGLIDQIEDAVYNENRSPADIAKSAGISYATLRTWFNGTTANPNTRTLLSLCHELGAHIGTCRKTGYPILKGI